jgi:hypothetical protein
MTIVDHDEAEHKGRGRDESSLDDVVPCIIYNQRSHGLSGEADRNCWLAILHLDASLSTRSVMVVAGPEMAAGGVWDCRWGQWQRRWPTAGSSCSLCAHDQANRAAFLSARLKDSSCGRFCYSCELLFTQPAQPDLGPSQGPALWPQSILICDSGPSCSPQSQSALLVGFRRLTS